MRHPIETTGVYVNMYVTFTQSLNVFNKNGIN